jgi:hypothetical protein
VKTTDLIAVLDTEVRVPVARSRTVLDRVVLPESRDLVGKSAAIDTVGPASKARPVTDGLDDGRRGGKLGRPVAVYGEQPRATAWLGRVACAGHGACRIGVLRGLVVERVSAVALKRMSVYRR